MTGQDELDLRSEIQHIFDSGANEIRVFEMVKMFIDRRYVNKKIENTIRKELWEKFIGKLNVDKPISDFIFNGIVNIPEQPHLKPLDVDCNYCGRLYPDTMCK